MKHELKPKPEVGKLITQAEDLPPADAIKVLDSAITMAQSLGDDAGLTMIHYVKAQDYGFLRDASSAKKEALISLQLARKLKALDYELNNLDMLVTTASIEGRVSEARSWAELAMRRSANCDDLGLRGSIHIGYAEALIGCGAYPKALPEAKAAAAECEAIKDFDSFRVALSDQAACLRNLGRLADAINLYRNILIDKRLKHVPARDIFVRYNLATAYGSVGWFDLTRQEDEENLKICRDNHFTLLEMRVESELGVAYSKLGRYQDAERVLSECIPKLLSRHLTGEAYLAKARLAAAISQSGDRSRAGALFSAMTQAEKASLSTSEAADAAAIWSRVLLSDGKTDLALKEASLAWRDARQMNTPEIEVEALHALGIWAASNSNRPLAIALWKKAVMITESVRDKAKPLGEGADLAVANASGDIYRSLADALIDEGRISEAKEVMRLLKDAEVRALVRGEPGADPTELSVNDERWLKEYETLAVAVCRHAPEYAQLAAIKDRTKEEQGRLDSYEAELNRASEAFNRFLADSEATYAKAKDRKRMVVVRSAEALGTTLDQLPAKPCAIYTLVMPDRLRIILSLPTANVVRDSLIKQEDLFHLVATFRDAVTDPRIDPRPSGKKLYDVLVAPIRDQIEAAHFETLMFSLDGVLRYVPLAALWDGRAYLVQSFRSCLFNLSSNSRLTDDDKPVWKGLTLGVSKEHSPLSALPGVLKEAQQVNQVLGGDLLLDEQFTRSAFERAIASRPDVLHVASHFVLDKSSGDEKASYLLLGDGSHLTLADIHNMRSGFLNRVKLVTLSACDTAVGVGQSDGSEIEGLATILQDKGADAVLASLWPVSDQAAPLWMGAFYGTHKGGSVDKASAIREVQLRMIGGDLRGSTDQFARSPDVRLKLAAGLLEFKPPHGSAFEHPYYWAPFELLGNYK